MIMLVLPLLLSSCFTGIESTKKITLSREEKRQLEPKAEDLLLESVKASPLEEWPEGKVFYVTDDRASLLIDAQRIVSGNGSLHQCDTLIYIGDSMLTAPNGRQYPYVEFRRGEDIFGYAGRSSGRQADTNNSGRSSGSVMSNELPGVVDCAMLDKVRKILQGKELWTRSSLWTSPSGRRVEGLRFAPVTVTGIAPGDMVFPIKVEFRDAAGEEYYYTMNFGNTGKDSHSFSTLFFLSDPRQKYASISDQVWQNIMRGKVEIGMTKDECRLAKGNPSDVNIGHSYSKDLLLWSYPDATVLYFEDGILTGINNMVK